MKFSPKVTKAQKADNGVQIRSLQIKNTLNMDVAGIVTSAQGRTDSKTVHDDIKAIRVGSLVVN